MHDNGFEAEAAAIVGGRHILTDADDREPFERDWRGRYKGVARAVIRPAGTQEVADIVSLAARHGIGIVPQGGNTGLTGGAVPIAEKGCVVLNLSRMDRLRSLDIANNSVTVEAGMILQNLRERLAEAGRHFPMDLGSSGSCEVGGLVSTNAGGTAALRYGNMRQLVMGLEVVLPDGRIWNGLRALRKDNAGYDLKQLFIGAEGTLGIVTAATLKLYPAPLRSATAMLSFAGYDDALQTLGLAQERCGERIEAFEILSRNQIEIVLRHGLASESPVALDHPCYALVELSDCAPDWDPGAALETLFSEGFERGIVADGALATDGDKAERIWRIRHSISEANKLQGFTISNDTSVPVSRVPDFIERVGARLAAEVPLAEVCYCGHIGDGNVHVIALLPRDAYDGPAALEAEAGRVNAIVHEESVALDGSISAEHGIGLMHVDRLKRFKDPLELDLMRRIKDSLDPEGRMNPGKIF